MLIFKETSHKREAKMGFGDNIPKRVLGRQPYRNPLLSTISYIVPQSNPALRQQTVRACFAL